MINCGYAGDAMSDFPSELLRPGAERYGCQLYWRVLDPVCMDGDAMLEIGCGRGGGLDFASRSWRLSRSVGVDFSGALVQLCERQFGGGGIEFKRADALALPFEDESFNVAISVEASHAVADKKRYLSEALRVLKKGGIFVWVDFVYERESSSHSLKRIERTIRESGAQLLEQEELSVQALAALAAVSRDRVRRIERSVWRPFQSLARDFAVTEGSSLYQSLLEQRARYWSFQLKKD